jgi:hypothetical protein
MVSRNHLRQAIKVRGRKVTLKTREQTGYDRHDDPEYDTSSEKLRAKVTDAAQVGNEGSETEWSEAGRIPDKGKVVKTVTDVSDSDLVEIDGEDYRVMAAREIRGEKGQVIGYEALVRPKRGE